MIIIIYYPDSTTHCAIALTGLSKDKNFYLSFMPRNDGPGFRLHKMDDDFKHKATRIVSIPSEESCGYGLSEQAMYDWYQNEFTNQPSFSFFTHNCSSIAYKALVAGQLGSESLGNKIVIKKNWFLDYPARIIKYAKNLAEAIPDIVKDAQLRKLEKQTDYITDKILEMENLYNTKHIKNNEFAYSFLTKAIEIYEADVNNGRSQQALVKHFIKSLLAMLKDLNYDQKLIDEIKNAFSENDIPNLKRLSSDVLYAEVTTNVKKQNVLSLFNLNKTIKVTKLSQKLKAEIDDNKNIHKKYFEKKQVSTAAIAGRYRR